MRKTLTLALLSLIMVTCSQEEPIGKLELEKDASIGTYAWGSGEILPADISAYKKIATALVESELPISVCRDVYQIVQNTKEIGIGEGCYLKEALGDNIKMWEYSLPTTPRYLKNILKISVKTVNSDSIYVPADIYETVQIYWPYSENWDGVTKPVVTWYGEQYDELSNYAYYKENGEVKGLVVDEAYAKQHPVWIINSAQYPHKAFPNLVIKSSDDDSETDLDKLNKKFLKEFSIFFKRYIVNFRERVPYSADGTPGGTGIPFVTDESEINPGYAYDLWITNIFIPKTYVSSVFAGDIDLEFTFANWNDSIGSDGVLHGNIDHVFIKRSELEQIVTDDMVQISKPWIPDAKNMALNVVETKDGSFAVYSGVINNHNNLGRLFQLPYVDGSTIFEQKIFDRSFIFSNEAIKERYQAKNGMTWQFKLRRCPTY